MIPVRLTLLDTLLWHEPVHDCRPGLVWQPRGAIAFNGYRQRIRGFKL